MSLPDGRGGLAVLDTLPRPSGITPAQSEALVLLAQRVAGELDGRSLAAIADPYRAAFQNAPVELVLIRVGADNSIRYEDLNLLHRRNTGMRPETFIGAGPEDVFDPDMAAVARAKRAPSMIA